MKIKLLSLFLLFLLLQGCSSLTPEAPTLKPAPNPALAGNVCRWMART
jgi:hypothetical protein